MSLQIACSMFNNSCHALCMYSTVYYECRAGYGLVPGPPRPHHPPSCFPHYPSPSRPCPGCVFLWECLFLSGLLLNKMGQFKFYRNILMRRQCKSTTEDLPPNQKHLTHLWCYYKHLDTVQRQVYLDQSHTSFFYSLLVLDPIFDLDFHTRYMEHPSLQQTL